MFDYGTNDRLHNNINALEFLGIFGCDYGPDLSFQFWDITAVPQFHTTQVEAKCQQVQEQAEEREQELRNRISSAEEERILAENQVKDLKENIFELEDQVEQHRAVNCHTNQAVLDMESMLI